MVPPADESADNDPHRWSILVLLSVAELMGMSLWFTASAVAPDLAELWSLSPSQVGWLTTLVQLGFVVGTALAAVFNLADVFPSKKYFAVSAVLAAGVNAALLVAPGYGTALVLRFFTGFLLAGVYPPAMKMIATWFRSARGMAIGTVVGALTVGKAMPYLLKAIDSSGGTGMETVVLGASGGAALAGLLVLFTYRDGPFPFVRKPFSWGLVMRVMRDRPTRLATGGYLGHMWELYAAWATIGLFFLEFFGGDGHGVAAPLSAFGMIAIGGVGAAVAGVWADRLGRERITIWMMAASGTCALSLGWMMEMSAWLVVPVALVWGATIVSDSAQFSAIVTEVAPQEAVGTALTLQTSFGFLLSAVAIQFTTWVAATWGWGVAYSLLAIGPVVGIAAMARLRRVRAE